MPAVPASSMAQQTTASAWPSSSGSRSGPATCGDLGRAALAGPGAHRGQPRAERREPPGHGGADGAEADDEHGRVQQRPPGRPAAQSAAGQRGPRVIEPPGQRQQVQHGDLGHAVGVPAGVAGHPADPHAQLGRDRYVHPLQADAVLVDQAEAAGPQDRRADPGAERADHVDAVEVLGHPAGRAGGQLPAGQQRGDGVERQAGADLLPGEQDAHGLPGLREGAEQLADRLAAAGVEGDLDPGVHAARSRRAGGASGRRSGAARRPRRRASTRSRSARSRPRCWPGRRGTRGPSSRARPASGGARRPPAGTTRRTGRTGRRRRSSSAPRRPGRPGCGSC